MSPTEPFVSIATPAYNAGPFLAACIESILAQDYTNWEYVIVNNRSTDDTLAIAESYCRRDPRIRVITTDVFVNAEENYNNAFRTVEPRAAYCKILSADDTLLPHCVRRMVEFGLAHPSAGIIGAYQQAGRNVLWTGVAPDIALLSGREVCRLGLLKNVHVLGNPTSVLYRTDLLRRTPDFFPHGNPHADTSACYAHLHDCDFGFIHEILSVATVHEGQITARVERLDASELAYIDVLQQYGHLYLTPDELQERLRTLLDHYYRVLGRAVRRCKGREYWHYHRTHLGTMGHVLSRRRVLGEALRGCLNVFRKPRAL